MPPDTSEEGTVLLISNRKIDENAGRAEKFATRTRLLAARGWRLEVGYVDPTPAGTIIGLGQCLRKALRADVINSVSNPPELQIVGGIVSGLTGTPWVAEFRDPLVTNPDVETNSIAGRLRGILESYVLHNSDVTIWYDGIQIPEDYFETEYPGVPAERHRKLPTIGFERKKFDGIEPVSIDPFTVTYAGSFYEGWIEPYTFLEGLGKYVERTGDRNVVARFYGDWNERYDEAATDEGVSDLVDPRPFVPHEDIVAVLKGSDIQLYVGGSDERNAGNIPTKIYDYIGAGRPILAIVDPEFRVARLIEEYEFGIVVEPGDATGVCEALLQFQSGEYEYEPSVDARTDFTRERSNEAYVDALNRAVGDTDSVTNESA